LKENNEIIISKSKEGNSYGVFENRLFFPRMNPGVIIGIRLRRNADMKSSWFN